MKRIYLDNHATTQIDPAVFESMRPYFMESYGNPASVHSLGEEAKEAVEFARNQVASVINAVPDLIYFTNSATESNNIILNNFSDIVTTNSEHASVLECVKKLKKLNKINVLYVKINNDGSINLNKLRKQLCSRPDLLSVIFANNEIGTIHPMYEIGQLCKKYNVLLHTDATQAVGKTPIDVKAMNIFALTMSAHKIYGPKGVGALYVRKPGLITPLLYGGFQNVVSSGTQNVPAIVGFGKACELIGNNVNMNFDNIMMAKNRDKLCNMLMKLPNVYLNGTMENRLSNNINLTISGISAKELAMSMDDVIISGGSACKSGLSKPSHVLKAIQCKEPMAAIRISIGRHTTNADIEYAAKRIIETVNVLRSTHD